MSEIEIDTKAGTIKYPQYVKQGSMSVNRDCLDADDPDQTYNYLVRNGIVPEEYGIQHPHAVEFESCTRSQLINEILSLRREILAYHVSAS